MYAIAITIDVFYILDKSFETADLNKINRKKKSRQINNQSTVH